MEVTHLRLKGLKLITPCVFLDDRGFFKEAYQEARYENFGISTRFVQDNHSFSQKNVLRGLHFQLAPAQDKLVWVLQGKIYDVAVDLRKDSPTYGQWEGLYLDSDSHSQLFIPSGFAHGFCVVSDGGAHVSYKVSAPYDPAAEKTIRFDDPALNIAWPLTAPIISTRDRTAPTLQEIQH